MSETTGTTLLEQFGHLPHSTPLEVLESARVILTDPARWCRHSVYRNAQGVACPKDSACSCCLRAALDVFLNARPVVIGDSVAALQNAIISKFSDVGTIPDMNDSAATTHGDILAVLDDAIAKLKESVHA